MRWRARPALARGRHGPPTGGPAAQRWGGEGTRARGVAEWQPPGKAVLRPVERFVGGVAR